MPIFNLIYLILKLKTMKNKTLVNLLVILILSLSFNGCSKNDEATSTDATLKQKIIGKWKLTKETQGDYFYDYSHEINNEVTTHEYFLDGTLIFSEWGEVFLESYMISDNYLYHIEQSGDTQKYKILTLNNSELVLDFLEANETRPTRIRYYVKVN